MQQKMKNRISLLSAAVLLISILPGAVGETQARANTPSAVSILSPQPSPVSSSILTEKGTTVRLADWNIAAEPISSPAPAENLTEASKTTDISQTKDEQTTAETQQEGEEKTEASDPGEATQPEIPEPKPTRNITFTVSDTTAIADDFQLTTDDLLQGTLDVSGGVVTLTLTPTDTAYQSEETQNAAAGIQWHGLSAAFQVALTRTDSEPAAEITGQVTSLEKANGRLAFLLKGSKSGYTASFTDGSGNPVTGLKYSADGGKTWQVLWGLPQGRLNIVADGVVLLELAEETDLQICVAEAESLSEIVPPPDAELNHSPFVLTKAEDSGSITVGSGWQGCTVNWDIQMLTRNGEEIVWRSLDTEIPPTVQKTDGILTLTLPNEGDPVLAGTYRLILRWLSGEQSVYETTAEFFVSYPLAS